MDELMMEDMVENALEDTYGTTEADDFTEMADDGTMDDVALANALADEFASNGEIEDMEESDIAEAVAEAIAEEEAYAQAMDEEAFAEALAEELAAEEESINQALLEDELMSEL